MALLPAPALPAAPYAPRPAYSSALSPAPRRLWVPAILLLLLCSQVVVGIVSRNADEGSGDLSPLALVAYTGIYAVVIGALAFYWRLLTGWMLQSKLVLLLPALCLVSTVWSQDPSLTLRRSLVLLFTSCLGIFLGTAFSMAELSELVTVTALIVALLTFANAAISPGSMYDPVEFRSWRGLFTQKNVLGTFMALGIVSAIHAPFVRARWIKYSTLVLAPILLLLSRSSTSLLAVIGVVALLPVWRFLRVAGKHIVVMIVILALLAVSAEVLINMYASEILGDLGKNATLSGRTDLWLLILQAIARRPILGYGYNGFWLGLRGEALTVSAAAGWIVPHAHNGLLDILLGVGILGGVIFVFTYFRLISLAIQNARLPNTSFAGLWAGSFLVLLTIVNTTESLLMSANSIFWLLFVAVYASLLKRTETQTAPVLRRRKGQAPFTEVRAASAA